METIDSRPLLAEELTVLRKYAPSPLLSLGRTLAAGGFFSLLFLTAVLALSKYVEFVRTLEPLLFVAFAIWIASQMLNMWRSERKRSEILRTDLKGGTAEIRRYEATDAIRVEETEDEGTGFFLKLKDGRTLFLSGQHFYELEEEKKFPCASFEVVHTPHANWFLGFNCTGSYFEPSLRRGPFSRAEIKSGQVPRDGDVFEIDFESLRSSNSSFESRRSANAAQLRR